MAELQISTCFITTWIFVLCNILYAESQGIQNVLQYELLEEQDPGGLMVDILKDSGIGSYYPPEVLQVLTFSFLTRSAPNQEYFRIDERTGILSNILKVNREAICPNRPTCDINLDIKTQPHPYVQLLKVTISVIDINDNVPSFEDRKVSISVSESTMEGANFALPNAVDSDVGQYGIKGYKLEPDVKNFRLDGILNQDGSLDLHLILSSKLDREVQSMYNLKVLTWDGGVPQQTGTLSIDITVVDSNDNNPKFTNSIYDVQIVENIPIGTTVFQVKATDLDEGLNSALTYHFSRSTINSYGSMFGIDRNTGSIFTKGELDREKRDLYELSVMAKDRGQNALAAYAKVKIRVRDENDNAPVIKINPVSGAHANVPEGADNGTIVAQVVVSDTDSGQNGEFICSMISNQFDIIYLYGNEYKIVTTTTFDREVSAEHHATFVCNDLGSPSRSTRKDIPIYVTDINDHSPIFEKSEYNVEIMENNDLRSLVTQVTASDDDIGPNADIIYSIVYVSNGNNETNLGDLLTINPNTGVVRANIIFDYEECKSYRFTVTATDRGNPKLSDTSVLILNILDVNDEAPKFNTSTGMYSFGTFENQAVGTEIGTVLATDRDSFPYANVSYMLDTYNSDSSTFQIDSKTGKITTRKMLNREFKAEYKMVVIAYNQGTVLQSKIDVVVLVADKNDNPPLIDFPRLGNNTVSLMGNSRKGDIVTIVLAHDIDVGASAQLEFNIVYRNDDNLFDIDPHLGEVLLRRDLDSAMYDSTFDLVILVSDKGDPALSATGELYVFINGSFPAAHLASEGGSNNSIAVVIICILVFIIVIIITILFSLFMIRRRRLNRQRHQRQQKYTNYRIEASSNKNLVQLNTSGNSIQSDNSSNREHGNHKSSSFCSMQNGKQDGSSFTSDENATTAAAAQSLPTSYHSIYLEKLPAHSSVVKYSSQVCEENQKVPNSTYSHLGEVQLQPGSSSTYNHLGEVQLQVHDLLHNLESDREIDNSSVTDSGKGSSEGDAINRSSPMDDLKKYGILSHNTSFPPSDMQASNYVFSVQQQEPHMIVGPLARSSIRSNNPPQFNSSSHYDGKQQLQQSPHSSSSNSNPTKTISDEYIRKCSPVLKGCMQDRTKLNTSNDGIRKKTVHFVKPFCSTVDQSCSSSGGCGNSQSEPDNGYTSGYNVNNNDRNGSSSQFDNNNGPNSSSNISPNMRTDNYRNNNTNTRRLRFIPGNSNSSSSSNNNNITGVHMPVNHHQYLMPQSRDSLASDYDRESQFSDGDTTTSGSYCMDDEEEDDYDVIGPDVLV